MKGPPTFRYPFPKRRFAPGSRTDWLPRPWVRERGYLPQAEIILIFFRFLEFSHNQGQKATSRERPLLAAKRTFAKHRRLLSARKRHLTGLKPERQCQKEGASCSWQSRARSGLPRACALADVAPRALNKRTANSASLSGGPPTVRLWLIRWRRDHRSLICRHIARQTCGKH
jgi:hypothetical protein